ncbi:MAG: adenosylcobalamin-dependent ribonucleoside-diphosphate reductase [Pseudomonadota bacterium]
MYHFSHSDLYSTHFEQPISEQIWRAKYQDKKDGRIIDFSVEDTWARVAKALVSQEVEASKTEQEARFTSAMRDFKLLPAGRILVGAGSQKSVTLSNTFVMKTLPDSLEGIMDVVKEAALTMKMGGGLGFDFSTLRPKGFNVDGLDCPAAGPLAAMDICDAVCRMLVSGMGRGAMMGTLRDDHPDIEAFIVAKADPARMRNFNLSVMVSDAFMQAVAKGQNWALRWNGKVVRTIDACALWTKIMEQNYKAAEPGVLFIDRINARNPLNYSETISATNSCAEQPLPPNGTCPLASINLARLVKAPFGSGSTLDPDALQELVETAVRMLDNTLDVSDFATPDQMHEAQSKRRVGVGVTGVADALIMLGIKYGSAASVAQIDTWMRLIQNAAYRASALLAKERGTFPAFDKVRHLQSASVKALDPAVRALVAQYGLRNGALTTIAPTGTTSMFGGNVSSGIEPVFSTSYRRKITLPDGTKTEELVEDYAVYLYRKLHGDDAPLTDAFVTVAELSPADHLRIQAAAQKWIDSGISKTVNCPEDISFDDFQNIYKEAYLMGCKGCTTYRPNDITGSVLVA